MPTLVRNRTEALTALRNTIDKKPDVEVYQHTGNGASPRDKKIAPAKTDSVVESVGETQARRITVDFELNDLSGSLILGTRSVDTEPPQEFKTSTYSVPLTSS